MLEDVFQVGYVSLKVLYDTKLLVDFKNKKMLYKAYNRDLIRELGEEGFTVYVGDDGFTDPNLYIKDYEDSDLVIAVGKRLQDKFKELGWVLC